MGLLDVKEGIVSEKENNANTDNAINNYSLGPMNPSSPSKDYWSKMAKMFRITPDEVKRQRCGNCEYYCNTPAMMESMEEIPLNKYDLYDGQAQRGYCVKLDFICHTSRLCSVWEEKEFEDPMKD
jgi:Pyruvate/2-oxoacid:ferredoxin oxidoreductase delta subunit